jgi:selenocysteine-specific elongation factor
MTIDLGFATCVLPNNRRVGIVDVPGHERFIHNMVAGATGIDVVMLVVAADDGVMPQTIEHFHIVRLLGITSGMVAVTKIDMVAKERVIDVVEQVKHLVQGSFLEGCPITPVSSKTGEGFDGFYDAFVATVDKTAQRNSSGAFRMHVERSFVLQGIGTVISGIPRSGSVHEGDTLELLPNGGKKRVRGVQVYGEDSEVGKAGECLALKLSDITREEAKRGMVLATPGYFTPTRFVNARFYSLPNMEKPLKPRCGIKFHIGTAEIAGYMVLPELKPMAPGTEAYVQFQLNEPIVAAPGDFFVARLLSPVRTIGGGTVVSGESSKMRRSKGNWTETVKDREKAFGDPEKGIEYVLESSGGAPLHVPELAKKALVNEESAWASLAKLVQEGKAGELSGSRYVHSKFLAVARDELLSVLGKMHDAQPLSLGFQKKDVFRIAKSDHALLDKALDELMNSGQVRSNETGLQVPSRAPKLTERQMVTAGKITETYRKTGFASPRRDELPQLLGMPAGLIDPVLKHLLQTGEMAEISDKVLLHRDLLEESKRKLVEYLQRNGSIEPGQAKDVLGTTRKYVIPLLEYWDLKGLTKRVGNGRVLK